MKKGFKGLVLLLAVAVMVSLAGCSGGTPSFSLTVTKEGDGAVAVTPSKGTFTNGEKVSITAAPGANHSFSHFEVNGSSDAANPVSFEMRKNTTVKAVFKSDPVDPGNLMVNIKGDGRVIKDPQKEYYNIGDIVTLTAVSGAGWYFDHWEGDLEGSEPTNPELVINLDAKKTVTAVFGTTNFLLNIALQGEGTVTRSPEKTAYNHGETVALTATPAVGWLFDHWEGDLASGAAEETITVDTNKNVTAVFVKEIYTITTANVGMGMVGLSPQKTGYTYGEQVEVSVAPMSGWLFDHWEGDLNGTEMTKTITIDGNKTVTAFFRDYAKVTVNYTGAHSPEVTLAYPDRATIGGTYQLQFVKRSNCTYEVDVSTSALNQTQLNDNLISVFNVNKDITVNLNIDEFMPVSYPVLPAYTDYATPGMIGSGEILVRYNDTYVISGLRRFLNDAEAAGIWRLKVITVNGVSKSFSFKSGTSTSAINPISIVITVPTTIDALYNRY